MMMRNYMSMTNGDYHNKLLDYNLTAANSAIRQAFPNEINPDLNDPKYHEFLKQNAFNPDMIGGLAESLALDKKILTTELWEDLCNGWAPVSEKSELFSQAIDTPRGKMVQFAANSTPINPDGSYKLTKSKKNARRTSTEFMFVFGERLSTAIGLMATQDPSIELQFKEICMEVFKDHVLPEMLNLARIRKGANGVDYEAVAELLAVPFLHSENRSEAAFYHFHFDLMNVARAYDGELYTLCTDEIGANASALDAIFMSQMKERLEQKFGFVFEEVKHRDDVENEFLDEAEKKTVSFDLPEEIIPENVREYRSAREKEMTEALKKAGKKGYEAEELARHATRDDKTEKSPAELRQMWDQDFKKMGWTLQQFNRDLEAYKKKATGKQQPTPTEAQLENRFLRHNVKKKPDTYSAPSDEILEDSFLRNHKDVAFTEYQYKAHIHKQLLAHMTSEEAQREATRIFEKTCNLAMSKDQMEYFKPLLEDTITNPVERQSMQLRFMREARFIHTSTIERDKYICESLVARKDETKFIFNRDEVMDYILDFEAKQKGHNGKPFTFSEGQRAAISMMLSDPGAACNVSGRAGAGKSTAMKCVREFLVERGYHVLGTSTSSSATTGLAKDTGMKDGDFYNTTNLVRRLNDGELTLTEKSIVVWDEAGMADSKTFFEVIKHVNSAGAKLILVGEKEQLQPIGAGGNFKRLNEQLVTTPIHEITRQVDSWQRDMVNDFASGRSQKAIRTLYENGKVIITKTEDERLARIVEDYMTAKETVCSGDLTFAYTDKQGNQKILKTNTLTYQAFEKTKNGEKKLVTKTFTNEELLAKATSDKPYDRRMIKRALEQALGIEIKRVVGVQDSLERTEKDVGFKDKIIIAPTNNDIDMINEKVREQLKAKRLLPAVDVTVTSKDGQEQGFAVGDRIIFVKNQKSDDQVKHNLMNANQGSVSGFVMGRDGQPKAMTLTMDDGKVATLDLSKKHNIKHAYTTSVHKSQGQTKQSVFYYVSANMNSLHSAYVACSRHRKNLHMYLSEDMVETMEHKMDGKAPTAQMAKVAEWVAKEQKLTLTPETLQSFTDTRAWLNENWKKVAGDEPHILDRFTSIFEAMAKTMYKRTSDDYEILDGKAKNTYEALKVARIEQIRTYKQKAVEPPKAIQVQIARRQVTEATLRKREALKQAKKLAEQLAEKLQKPRRQTQKSSLRR